MRRNGGLRTSLYTAVVMLAHTVSLSVSAAPILPSQMPHAPHSSGLGVRLNLASPRASVSASNLSSANAVSIKVGNSNLSVNSKSLLTPAETIAVNQVTHTGHQTVVLDISGRAIGGVVNLNSQLSTNLNQLVVPKGVTLFDVSSANSLNISGNLYVSGKLYLAPISNGVFSLGANNIAVGDGGLISTILPSSFNSQVHSSPGVNLVLNTTRNINNSGLISAGGSLSLNAGGSIHNVSVGHDQATISANQAINVSTGSGVITNSGLVASVKGNININTGNSTADLNVDAQGGSFQAAAANINVMANNSTSSSIKISGGNFFSHEFNLVAEQGNVNINAGQISGVVNIEAVVTHVVAASPVLNLDNIQLSGDPTFYNTAGAVNLTLPLTIQGAGGGADLAVIAATDIHATGRGNIDLGSSSGNGGNILLMAGAQFSSTPATSFQQNNDSSGSTLTITGASSTGGKIDFSGATIGKISSSSTAGNAGNITLIAFNGTAVPESGAGTINLGVNTSIVATGSSGFSNGNVSIIAGASGSAPFNSISIGSITTFASGGATQGGSITIAAATPNLTTSFVLTNNVDGSVSGSANSPITVGTVQQNSMVTTGALNAGITGFGAANVSVTSGGNLLVGGSVSGANLNLASNSSTPFILGIGGLVTSGVLGTINAITTAAGGGAINLSNGSGAIVFSEPLVNPSSSLTITASGSQIQTVYPVDLNLSETVPTLTIPAQGPLLISHGVQVSATSISLNGQVLASSLTEGLYGTPTYSISISGGPTGTLIVTPTTKVTPAEWVAAEQVQSTSTQTLTIGSNNAASGGSFGIISSNEPAGGFTEIVIPESSDPTNPISGFFGSIFTSRLINNGIIRGTGFQALSSGNLEIGGTGSFTAFNLSFLTSGAGSKLIIDDGTNWTFQNRAFFVASNIVVGTSGIANASFSEAGSQLLFSPNLGDTGSLSIQAGGTAGTLSFVNSNTMFVSSLGIKIGAGIALNTADSISLEDTGSVGISVSPGASIAANGLSIYSGGNVVLPNVAVSSLTLLSSANTAIVDSLPLTVIGSPPVNNAVAASLSLSASAVTFDNGNVMVNGGLAINTSQFKITDDGSITAGFLSVIGVSGAALSVSNRGFVKTTNGAISIASAAGENLNLSSGMFSTLQSNGGSVTLTATPNGNSANNIEFNSSQTFPSTTILTASTPFQSVILDANVVVTGKSALTVNTNHLVLQGSGSSQAQITGTPLILSASGAGTIASSNAAANLDLKNLGNLIFEGQNLTILSAGGIINSGKPISITLAGAKSATVANLIQGGSLQLIAGFNFSPTSSPSANPSTDSFQLGTSNVGKNISLANVSIDTSSFVPFSNGGNVLAVATGRITLGSIITDSFGSGTAGAVTIIGKGINLGEIVAGGQFGGIVSITSGIPVVVNGPLIISGGVITSGAFAPSTLSGNILVNNVSASKSIEVTTGGSGLISQIPHSILSASSLSIKAGTSGINLLTSAQNIQLNTGGNAIIRDATQANIESTNVGGALTFNGTSGVQISSQAIVVGARGVSIISSGGALQINNSSVLSPYGAISLSATDANSPILIDNASSISAHSSISITSVANITVGNAGGSATTLTAGSSLSVKATGSKSVVLLGANAADAIGTSVTISATNNTGTIQIDSAVWSAGTSMAITGNGGVTVGNGINSTLISTQKGSLSVSSLADITIGANVSIISQNSISLLQSSSTGKGITIGQNATINAGLLKSGASLSNPLTSSEIEMPGAISILAVGINNPSNDAISVGANSRLISNGAGISLRSYQTNVQLQDSSAIQANGGNVSIFSGAWAFLGVRGGNGYTIQAFTLNNSAGAISVDASSGVVSGAGSIISGTSIALVSPSNAVAIYGTQISSGSNLLISGRTATTISDFANIQAKNNLTVSASLVSPSTLLSIGGGSGSLSLTSGALRPDACPLCSFAGSGYTTGSFSSAGSIVLYSGGAISMSAGTTPGALNSFTSNGGSISVTAADGNISVGSSSSMEANGGNVLMFAKGNISGDYHNNFFAFAQGTSAASSRGGAIEIGSGMTNSNRWSNALLSQNLQLVKVAAAALGLGVTPTITTGVVEANISGAGSSINLNAGTNGPSSLLLDRGAEIFDAVGGTTIKFDGNLFGTSGLMPISMTNLVGIPYGVELAEDEAAQIDNSSQTVESHQLPAKLQFCKDDAGKYSVADFDSSLAKINRNSESVAFLLTGSHSKFSFHQNSLLRLQKGELFIGAYRALDIQTERADIHVKDGALVSIKSNADCTYVRSCSPAGSIVVSIDGSPVALNAGEEIIISDELPSAAINRHDDGLGRRLSTSRRIGSKSVVVSDFSIITLASNSECLAEIIHSTEQQDKHLLGTILKVAASVDTVTRHKGPYLAR